MKATAGEINQDVLRERLTIAYSAGALEPALELMVETLTYLSPPAERAVQMAEAVSAALFEAQAPVAMRPDALSQVFARIEAEEPPVPAMRAAARKAGALIEEVLKLPQPVRDHALDAIGHGGWTFAGPGIRSLPLELSGGAKAELLRIEPGWGAPRHGHNAPEFTLVLTGAFVDERGRYNVGDIAFAGPGAVHRPTAAQGEVCYALAVTEAPPAFTGALGFIQKMWRH
jgi:putative transcriptional regulator